MLAVGAERLTVSLGGPVVLHDISLSVEAGQAVGLFGGNGSGKTTLIRTLLGLVKPVSGTSTLFGTDVAQFRAWSRVGYVPQRHTVSLDSATVKEVVASGRLAHRRPFMPARPADRRAVAEAMDHVDIATLAGQPFESLSGGQQQRVLIARALAGEPELLMFDEPLAGVDLPTQMALAQVLQSLLDQGRTLIVVLHESGPLGEMLQRRVTLDQGKIVTDISEPPSSDRPEQRS